MSDGSASSGLTWSDRFRGALFGGAVGDALGASVRYLPLWHIQQRHGQLGIADYVAANGWSGASTELTQLTAFTLDALLRAKAFDEHPVLAVRANQLSWLHTQGVPWEIAMAQYLDVLPEPSTWLLDRTELFSTRNPGGLAITGLGQLARCLPDPQCADPHGTPPPLSLVYADSAVWSAPSMLWSSNESLVSSLAGQISGLLASSYETRAAAAAHADILSQLMRGEQLWEAANEWRHNRAYLDFAQPAEVIRTINAAKFVTAEDREPDSASLDVEFEAVFRLGALGIALTAVVATDTFIDAVALAANHSGDSSVSAALAGQLAGALYGPDAIPERWLEELELRDILETLCVDAAEAFAPITAPPPAWTQRYRLTAAKTALEAGAAEPVSQSTVEFQSQSGHVSGETPSLSDRVLGSFLLGAAGGLSQASEDAESTGTLPPHHDALAMMLFTAEGLIRASVARRSFGVTDPLAEVQLAHRRWRYLRGVEWAEAAGRFLADHPVPDGWLVQEPALRSDQPPGDDSQTGGALLRVVPAALYSSDPAEVFDLAARIAMITDGEPGGYLPAGVFAVIIQQILQGRGVDDGVWLALKIVETWEGHEDTVVLLNAAIDLAKQGVLSPQQIEEAFGGGRTGAEALAIAVGAAFAGADTLSALETAADGGTEMTAAICGFIVGAVAGAAALPARWLVRADMRDLVQQIAADVVAECGTELGGAEAAPADASWHARYPIRPLWSKAADAGADEFPPVTFPGDQPPEAALDRTNNDWGK